MNIQKRKLAAFITAILAIGITVTACGSEPSATNKPSQTIEETVDPSTEETTQPDNEVNEPSETPEVSTPDETSSTETMGQKNAARAAKTYLDVMSFSYSGLVEQLEFEGYSHEDATYGADHCGADWNEQAAKSAETYLEMMPFSRDALIEQLEHDGFTYEQATYGAEANGY